MEAVRFGQNADMTTPMRTTRHQANEPDPDYDNEVTETLLDGFGHTEQVTRYEADPKSEDGTGLRVVEVLEPDDKGELKPVKKHAAKS